MERVLSAVRDPGMDRLDLALAAPPLGLRQLILEIAVEPRLLQLGPSEHFAAVLCPRSIPTMCVRLVVWRSTSQTMLQSQRPRASCEKVPDLNRPWISRCFHSRILRPRNIAIELVISTSWFVNGTQPSERRGPRLTRQRSLGRPTFFRLVRNSSMTS